MGAYQVYFSLLAVKLNQVVDYITQYIHPISGARSIRLTTSGTKLTS